MNVYDENFRLCESLAHEQLVYQKWTASKMGLPTAHQLANFIMENWGHLEEDARLARRIRNLLAAEGRLLNVHA